MEAVLGQGGGANKYSSIGLNKGNMIIIILVWSQYIILAHGGGGTPLYGLYRYVRPQGYGFSVVLVINWVWILAILVIIRVSIFAL